MNDYIGKINKLLNYIDAHLHEELSLTTVAQQVYYSPYHLHRLFKAITNETLNNYISRKRIEKAAHLLIHRPDYSISTIAHTCGFNSNAAFSRAFQKAYACSASNFRKQQVNQFSKISKTSSKNGKVNRITEEYLCTINNLKNWITMNATTQIKKMPAMELAYLTQKGTVGLEATFNRIVDWANVKGLLEVPNAVVVRVFHDSFKITDEDKVRMSIGVSINTPIKVDGEVSLLKLPETKCLVARFEIEPIAFEKSWNALFINMSERGLKKAAANPFEIYYNNRYTHPEKKCIVDLCIPVE